MRVPALVRLTELVPNNGYHLHAGFHQPPGRQAGLAEQRQSILLAPCERLPVNPQRVADPCRGEELEGTFTVPIESTFGEGWIRPCIRRVELVQEQSPLIESGARDLRRVPRAEHEPSVECDGPERVALRRFALKVSPERVEARAEEPPECPGTLVGGGTKALPPG